MSHACVVAANQALFARVAQRTGWELTLVVPRSWRNELGTFDAERYRSRIWNRSDSLVVGFVGRLVPEKGPDVLLEALAPLPGDVRAIVVGAGEEAARLEARSARLGLGARIDWRGYVPHDAMADVYSELDVLVVPSRTTARWKEQFGRVVIEALAAAVPVVASDCGSLPALLERTGGGWVVPEGDDRALAQRLLSLRHDPEALRR